LRHQRINGIAVDGPKVVGKWQEVSLPKLGFVIYTEARRPGRCSIRSPTRPGRPSPSSFPRRRYRRTGVADCRRSAVRRTVELVTRSLGKETPTARKRQPPVDAAQHGLVVLRGQASITGGASCPRRTALALPIPCSTRKALYSPLRPSASTAWSTSRAHIHALCSDPLVENLSLPGDNTLFGPGLYTIRRPSSRKIVTLTIGLAGDGLVARTIIARSAQPEQGAEKIAS